jgi:glycosyltransferase involved in cell wall biosynthesis
MKATPLISVLIPVYNGMPYLPESIESVRGQTFEDFEIVALDDGSTDGTASYLASISDARLRVEKLGRGGLSAALNHGLRVARAPLVARIDADDVAMPERFRLQFDYLRQYPNCLALGCQSQHVNERGEAIGEGRYPTSPAAIRWEALFRSPILHPGSMYRREPVLAVGGYRKEFDVAEDYDLWTRLLTRGAIGNLPQQLLRYRVHSRSVCSVHKDRQVRQGGRIAGAYVSALSAGVEGRCMEGLYLFLATGRAPETCSMDELIAAFHAARDFFQAQADQSDAELETGINRQQDNLRWRCTVLAEQNWLRPWRALTWLRRAARVDPSKAGLSSLVRRRWSRVVEHLKTNAAAPAR